MSELRVSNVKSRKRGQLPTLPDGAVVTGVTTSTFSGDLTGDVTGNITGTTGTFSGDVSVGGAISYEDVSDIDSVGVITARSGIKVGAGQSISPVSGTITYYGDGSGLTGVSAGSHNFVASGTIPNGATVIVNTDGTVGVVTATVSPDPSAGTPTAFDSDSVLFNSAAYDPDNGKVIILYYDEGNSGYATAVVGTVSGTSITFGSPVVVHTGGSFYCSVAYDTTNDKAVFGYRGGGNSNQGTARVGTISGNSISLGSEVIFETGQTNYLAVDYVGSGKVVFAYQDGGNTDKGTVVVGTVSGTSISFGTPTLFEIGATDSVDIVHIGSGKIVIAYRDRDNSFYGTAVVGEVSGTSVGSIGSAVVFNSASSEEIAAVYDSTNDKVVIAYKDTGGNEDGEAIVGTVSGTSISFGTAVQFSSGNTTYISGAYDSANGKVVLAYKADSPSNNGEAIVGTVSGTSISFGNPVVFGKASYTAATYDSTNQKVVVAYQNNESSGAGTGVVISSNSVTTNLTSENYIGIAAEAIADGQTGKITVVTGINEGQTGLTTGRKYYVQGDGSLGTSAGSPSVVAGTSISSTKITVR
jgi:hypothetical protein